MNPGELNASSMLYSSIIHAMICEFVNTSGAGISFAGPTNCEIARTYPRDRRSTSSMLISRGSHMIPPLPPPYGRSTIPAFNVIHIDNATTSSSVTSGWNLTPPFVGPTASLCCARKPVNTCTEPSSIRTGIRTLSTLIGSLINSYMPSSKPNLSNASLIMACVEVTRFVFSDIIYSPLF